MIFDGPWAIIDPCAEESGWEGIPTYRSVEQAVSKHGPQPYIPAIADPRAKHRLIEEMRSAHLPLAAPLIHPRAYVHRTAKIGQGCVVYPTACISHSVVLEECVYVLFGCSIGHEVHIGPRATLSPAVVISGNVTVEAGVFFGTTCCVYQGLRIGENCRLGMGSILTESLPARTNAMTNPRLMKLPLEEKKMEEQ